MDTGYTNGKVGLETPCPSLDCGHPYREHGKHSCCHVTHIIKDGERYAVTDCPCVMSRAEIESFYEAQNKKKVK